MNLTQFDDIDLGSFFNLTEPEVVVLRVRLALTFKTNEIHCEVHTVCAPEMSIF